MKKILIISLSFTILSFKAFAQEADLVLNKKDAFYEKPKFLCQSNDYFLLASQATKKQIDIYKYSVKDLSKIDEKEIKFPIVDGEITEYLDLLYFKSKICLFTTVYSKKEKYHSLYITEINNDGGIITKAKLVDNIKWTNKCFETSYKIFLSNDSSKILIYHRLDECDDKNLPGKFSLKILNDKIETLVDKEFQLSHSFSKYEHSKFLLDKGNNIYFIEKEYENSKDKFGDLFKISVVRYNSKDNKLIKNEVDINEKRFLNIDLQLTKQEDAIVTGAYAIDENYNDNWKAISCLKGLFCILIDKKTDKVIVKYKRDLDELLSGEKKTQMIQSFNGATFITEDGKHLYRYNLKNTFQLDNDQVVLLTQFEHSVNGLYMKGPIIGVNFNLKNEKENWLKIYPLQETKKNETNSKETFPYIGLKRNNSIYLLYNFNRQIQINPNGEYTDKTIYPETKENKKHFLCNIFTPINLNELFILTTESVYVPNAFNYRISKIHFKD